MLSRVEEKYERYYQKHWTWQLTMQGLSENKETAWTRWRPGFLQNKKSMPGFTANNKKIWKSQRCVPGGFRISLSCLSHWKYRNKIQDTQILILLSMSVATIIDRFKQCFFSMPLKTWEKFSVFLFFRSIWRERWVKYI